MITLERMAVLFREVASAEPEQENTAEGQSETPPLPPDLAAMIRLSALVKLDAGEDMISYVSEDYEVVMRVDPEALAAVASEEDIRYLARCGLYYDPPGEYFSFIL
jgi:hypothetical protein